MPENLCLKILFKRKFKHVSLRFFEHGIKKVHEIRKFVFGMPHGSLSRVVFF